ncbi:MAG: hypothetical protein ACX932_02575 [Gammaproteobacteria bacterium]
MKKYIFGFLTALLPCTTFSAMVMARYMDINIRNNTDSVLTCYIDVVQRGTLTFPGDYVVLGAGDHLRRGSITARMGGGHRARGTLHCILHNASNDDFFLYYRYEASDFRRVTGQATLEGRATQLKNNTRVVVLKRRSSQVTSYDPMAKPALTYVVWSTASS